MEPDPIVWTRAYLGERGLEALDVVMKRNLTFASWRQADGQTGTWILCWGPDGQLLSRTEA